MHQMAVRLQGWQTLAMRHRYVISTGVIESGHSLSSGNTVPRIGPHGSLFRKSQLPYVTIACSTTTMGSRRPLARVVLQLSPQLEWPRIAQRAKGQGRLLRSTVAKPRTLAGFWGSNQAWAACRAVLTRPQASSAPWRVVIGFPPHQPLPNSCIACSDFSRGVHDPCCCPKNQPTPAILPAHPNHNWCLPSWLQKFGNLASIKTSPPPADDCLWHAWWIPRKAIRKSSLWPARWTRRVKKYAQASAHQQRRPR